MKCQACGYAYVLNADFSKRTDYTHLCYQCACILVSKGIVEKNDEHPDDVDIPPWPRAALRMVNCTKCKYAIKELKKEGSRWICAWKRATMGPEPFFVNRLANWKIRLSENAGGGISILCNFIEDKELKEKIRLVQQNLDVFTNRSS